MTHCSLGTDKDMETQENETNQDTTTNKRHTHTTSFLLASIPLLFLFFVMQRPPSPTETSNIQLSVCVSFLLCFQLRIIKNKKTSTPSLQAAGCARFHLTRSTDASK